MRKRYSRSYTVLSFLTMFSYREQPLGRLFFYVFFLYVDFTVFLFLFLHDCCMLYLQSKKNIETTKEIRS